MGGNLENCGQVLRAITKSGSVTFGLILAKADHTILHKHLFLQLVYQH